MSTLDKTINMLNSMPQEQVEAVYNFAVQLNSSRGEAQPAHEAEAMVSKLEDIGSYE